MKKSILIGVLCALMLFTFAACDNSVPTYKVVNYVSLSQTQDVIKGQPFSGDMIAIDVHYTDGSVDTISGKGYVSETADTSKEFTVSVNNFAGADKADLIIVPVDATSATVEAVAANRAVVTDSEDSAAGPVTLTDYTVTLTSASGSYTFSKADNVTAYTVTADNLTAEQKKTIGTYDVALNVAYNGAAVPTESTVAVEVYDGSEPKPDTTAVGIVATVTSADDYYGTAVTVTLNYVNASKEKLSTVDSSAYYVMDSEGKVVSNPFSSLKLGDKTVNYTVRTTGRNYMECDVVIPAGENYITNKIDDVNIVVANGEKTWKAGDSVSVSDFKIEDELTFAIEGNTTSDDYINFTVSEAGSDFRLSEGENTIHYQLQYSLKGVEGQTPVKTLTINVQ